MGSKKKSKIWIVIRRLALVYIIIAPLYQMAKMGREVRGEQMEMNIYGYILYGGMAFAIFIAISWVKKLVNKIRNPKVRRLEKQGFQTLMK